LGSLTIKSDHAYEVTRNWFKAGEDAYEVAEEDSKVRLIKLEENKLTRSWARKAYATKNPLTLYYLEDSHVWQITDGKVAKQAGTLSGSFIDIRDIAGNGEHVFLADARSRCYWKINADGTAESLAPGTGVPAAIACYGEHIYAAEPTPERGFFRTTFKPNIRIIKNDPKLTGNLEGISAEPRPAPEIKG
jgi:hypothetical protein